MSKMKDQLDNPFTPNKQKYILEEQEELLPLLARLQKATLRCDWYEVAVISNEVVRKASRVNFLTNNMEDQ